MMNQMESDIVPFSDCRAGEMFALFRGVTESKTLYFVLVKGKAAAEGVGLRRGKEAAGVFTGKSLPPPLACFHTVYSHFLRKCSFF